MFKHIQSQYSSTMLQAPGYLQHFNGSELFCCASLEKHDKSHHPSTHKPWDLRTLANLQTCCRSSLYVIFISSPGSFPSLLTNTNIHNIYEQTVNNTYLDYYHNVVSCKYSFIFNCLWQKFVFFTFYNTFYSIFFSYLFSSAHEGKFFIILCQTNHIAIAISLMLLLINLGANFLI